MGKFIKDYGSYLIWGITVFYYFVISTESEKTLMFDNLEQKNGVVQHYKDIDVHMPMARKMEVFVPRSEIEGILKGIDDKQDLIIQMIKEK